MCKMEIQKIVQARYHQFDESYQLTGIAKSYTNFLDPDIAEACYRDLSENVVFEPHTYGTLTNMQIASRPIRETYDGEIKRAQVTKDTELCNRMLELFQSSFFIDFVSQAIGEPVHFVRSATPYKFEKGNYLCFHDDMSDPYHACEVVLNLTKFWDKSYGGYSMGGYIAERRPWKTPEEFPFELQKIVLDRTKPFYCSQPVFNKLSILRLSEQVCHGTSIVHVDNRPRIVIAAIYAGLKARQTTTKWKETIRL